MKTPQNIILYIENEYRVKIYIVYACLLYMIYSEYAEFFLLMHRVKRGENGHNWQIGAGSGGNICRFAWKDEAIRLHLMACPLCLWYLFPDSEGISAEETGKTVGFSCL